MATLVLSGNSTNAVVTLGALERLNEEGRLRRVNRYVATSSGSVLSLLLAIGYSPLDLLIFLSVERPFRHVKMDWIGFLVGVKNALNDFQQIYDHLTILMNRRGWAKDTTLSRLRAQKGIVWCAVTFDVTSGETVYLHPDTHPDLSLIDGCRMSCNFPFIFPPFQYGGHYFFDGGLADNFPLHHALRVPSDEVIAVYTVNPIPPLFSPDDAPRWFYFKTILSVIMKETTRRQLAVMEYDASVKIYPIECAFDPFNFNSDLFFLLTAFDRGYTEMIKNLQR